jgi:DedD protein
VTEKPVEAAAGKADKPGEKTAAKPAEKPAAKAPEKAAEKTPAKADKPQEKKAAEPAKDAKSDKEAKPQAGGFVVQLGAFSNADNAKQLQAKLTANHVKAYTDTLKTSAGDRTRVRAGPYPSREEADKALVKIKQLGLDGKVVPK